MVANQPLYIYKIGGQNRNNGEGGFNGGGRGSVWCSPYGQGCGYALGGGGATDIRSNVDDLTSRLVVAGGGGGFGGPVGPGYSGGSGGGEDGTTGSGWAGSGTGATTTRPGVGNCLGSCGGSGSFGIGGDGVLFYGSSGVNGGGGGGGYFGGGGGTNTNHLLLLLSSLLSS